MFKIGINIKYIVIALILLKTQMGSAQKRDADTSFRNKDTIWINFSERLEIDTSFKYVKNQETSEINNITYQFITDRNLQYLISKITKEISSAEESYFGEFQNATMCGVSFEEIAIITQNNRLKVELNGLKSGNMSVVNEKITAIFKLMQLENQLFDTIQFELKEYELETLEYNDNNDLIRIPIPDSLIELHNQDKFSYDVGQYFLRDNYLEFQKIIEHSNLPIGRIEEMELIISEEGQVKDVVIKLLEQSNYIKVDNVFKELKFPILMVNGKNRIYKIFVTDEEYGSVFDKPLKNRFDRDLQLMKNIYPIFTTQDSLFLYKSETDSVYFLYTTLNHYKRSIKYLTKFLDTNSVESMFYDFNKDGVLDFVYPPNHTQPYLANYVVIYGGDRKDETGLTEPYRYFNLKYSADSLIFSTDEKSIFPEYRKISLYSFKAGGDSILLGCTQYQIPMNIFAKNKRERFPFYAIPHKGRKSADVYQFVNNLDKSLPESVFYINKLSRAKKAFKKMQEKIHYYRDHPDKIL